MTVVIDNRTYYRTAEVCRIVGICRNTLFRWLKEGVFSDVEYRDWRGWRLFTAAQLETLRKKNNHVISTNWRSQRSMQMEKTL
jgi:predicted site-specific integrase-resolvase